MSDPIENDFDFSSILTPGGKPTGQVNLTFAEDTSGETQNWYGKGTLGAHINMNAQPDGGPAGNNRPSAFTQINTRGKLPPAGLSKATPQPHNPRPVIPGPG